MDSEQPRKASGPNWLYVTPLALTLLPLIRIALRKQPVLRDRVFAAAVGVAFVHGAWLIARTPDDDGGREQYMRAPAAAAVKK